LASNRRSRLQKIGTEADHASDADTERLCAVTRQHLEPENPIRFVQAPDGQLVPDLEHRLPGRGVWVTANREMVEKAIKTRAFDRSLKATATVAPDLATRIEAMMLRRACDTLALANKAGLAVAGFQQVDSALDKAKVAVLIHGCDAAADGCAKLDRKFRAIQGDLGQKAPVVAALTITEMSLAMGRPSVVHAALIPGGLAKRFLREAGRLVRYRSSSAASEVVFSELDNEG
jgi:uncharacterized protein